jgi:hypothetical protein
MKARGQIPPAYKTKLDEEPTIDSSIRYYISSYIELDTCRLMEGGAIPWTAIREFGLSDGLKDDILWEFHECIRALDRHVLSEAQEERDKKLKRKGK